MTARGKDAAASAGKWKPAWGEAGAGLKLGLAIPRDSRRFRFGDRVPVELYIQNVGDAAITFSYLDALWPFDILLQQPRVLDERNQELKIPAFGLGGYPTIRRELVSPGAIVAFKHPGVLLGRPGTDKPPASSPDTVLVPAGAGRFRIQQSVRLDVVPPPNGAGFLGAQVLTSGLREFEILPD